MKNWKSFLAIIVIICFYIIIKINYGYRNDKTIFVTDWDAFGYYMYLPSIFIYQDVTTLEWIDETEKKYHVLGGGQLYQAIKQNNGKYTNKYLGGVAILQMPYFFIGHIWAKLSGKPQDGFSQPYQFSIGWGMLLSAFLSLFLLRKILLYYFSDAVVAVSIFILMMATNAIQYIGISTGMSHVAIFPLYVLQLYFSYKWHQNRKSSYAFCIGYILGLATMSRPTEAIMLFIPLLWDLQNSVKWKEKWQFIWTHPKQLVVLIIGGLIGILPQLLYWKFTTGSFIFDVGSKWYFLNPFFRVLIGFNQGWFIYTPITIFFIISFLFSKKYDFHYSILVFTILNIYIVIAWSDWLYGASYSTRALVQSYPIFTLPFAAFLTSIRTKLYRLILFFVFIILCGVNIFQIMQYNNGVIHTRDNNFLFYKHIFLQSNPSLEVYSLLDVSDYNEDENCIDKKTLFRQIVAIDTTFSKEIDTLLYLQKIEDNSNWYKCDIEIKNDNQFFENNKLELYVTANGQNSHRNKIRLNYAYIKGNEWNKFSFWYKSTLKSKNASLLLLLRSEGAEVKKLAYRNIKISQCK